jgi:tetratricopeptide (TPR) repeat protein
VLAREAADADDETLTTIDTLGYVYLQSGQYEAALWQFQYAIANSDPPVAEYFYHLGLTLAKLERRAEARYALTRALAIDPQYSDAAEALRSLQPPESTAGPGASGAS